MDPHSRGSLPARIPPARPWHWVLGTWFGSGFSPFASGTAGTAASLPLVWLCSLAPFPGPACLAAALLLFYPGVLAATAIEKATGRHDSGLIVVDETVGTLLSFAFLPAAAFASWKAYALGFVLFRVVDVWKPWVIGYSQALPRGWGVMMDDVLGGLLCGLIMGGAAWLAWI